jgi:hypothetical protein
MYAGYVEIISHEKNSKGLSVKMVLECKFYRYTFILGPNGLPFRQSKITKCSSRFGNYHWDDRTPEGVQKTVDKEFVTSAQVRMIL